MSFYGAMKTQLSVMMQSRVILILVLLVHSSCGSEIVRPNLVSYTQLQNMPYGSHERNKFDLYVPDSEAPTPLVIFFHGGSFVSGDKSNLGNNYSSIQELLDNNIAFASVNYRYSSSSDYQGVAACMNDAQRFVQFIRYHSDKFNIDKSRLGVFGVSAGSGISLHLALNDDMADPTSFDPILRESTKVNCAAAIETQATYDFTRWGEFIPNYRPQLLATTGNWRKTVVNFFGYPNYRSFRPVQDQLLEKYDMLDMISEDDPPIWFKSSLGFDPPTTWNHLVHHPAHATVLIEKLSEYGIDNYADLESNTSFGKTITLANFFILYLKH